VKKKAPQVDPRDISVDQHLLEHIANCPCGGSGEGTYISGRIQSMARELLKYRAQGEQNG